MLGTTNPLGSGGGNLSAHGESTRRVVRVLRTLGHAHAGELYINNDLNHSVRPSHCREDRVFVLNEHTHHDVRPHDHFLLKITHSQPCTKGLW